jgi:GNAT superfamily N-acetyltransferase
VTERERQGAEIEVRDVPPTSDDARICLERYYRELEARFEGGFDPQRSSAPSVEEFLPPRGAFLVIHLNGAPVACGGIKSMGDAAYLKRMWVSPDTRGLGIGRRLLRALEEKAAALGYARACLETHKALVEAQHLYRSAGYREVPPFNDEPYAHHWFEKSLS